MPKRTDKKMICTCKIIWMMKDEISQTYDRSRICDSPVSIRFLETVATFVRTANARELQNCNHIESERKINAALFRLLENKVFRATLKYYYLDRRLQCIQTVLASSAF